MVSVVGLMILTSIPVVTGIGQAVHGQKEHKQREKDARRMQKFHIDVFCEAQSSRIREIHNKRLVLRDDLVWIGPHGALNPYKDGYVVEAFYIEYPDNEVSDPGSLSAFRLTVPLANPCSTWACQSSSRRSSAAELDLRGQRHDGAEIW